jgi:hypothetical protein
MTSQRVDVQVAQVGVPQGMKGCCSCQQRARVVSVRVEEQIVYADAEQIHWQGSQGGQDGDQYKAHGDGSGRCGQEEMVGSIATMITT